MHALTQCCALLLLMHLLTVAQCADCTLENFKRSHLFDENFELANLNPSYPSGQSVRVYCKVGYNGFFKIICSNGEWVPRGDKCKPISCGHPGDASFADFRLVRGTDYEFGSQVLYTCHKGYQMTSYTNTRNCLQGGWDGHLPECEPISCPSISDKVADNVLVYGDLEQPTSGSVLQFDCRSPDYMLVGAAQIFCDENGKWNQDPPMCQEISCAKPESDNLKVDGDKMTYKQGQVLRYSCNRGYRRVDGRPSVCRKQGLSAQWTPMPQCELITCKLSSYPPEGMTYDPPNQIIFKPGQRVRVSCGEKQWVKSIELQSAELTCQDTGRWDIEPECRMVTCSKIAANVNRWQWTTFNTIEMDQMLSYECYHGYDKTSDRAKCTRRGWEPDPLCKDRPCTLRYNPPEGTTYDPQNQFTFNPGQRVRVLCGEKHWVKSKELQSAEFTCLKGGRWDFTPECQLVTCSKTGENVHRWEHTWYNTVEMDTVLWYRCNEGYEETSPTAKCTRRGWKPHSLCKEKTCIQPSYKNADITGDPKEQYHQNERVYFKCTYDPATTFSVICHYGSWTSGQTCKEKPCTTQPVIKNGETHNQPKETYDHGQYVLFRCIGETETFRVTCQAGEWKTNKLCEDMTCTKPPVITNAEMVSQSIRTYPSGQTVEFRCTTDPRQNFTVSCQSGEWKYTHHCPECGSTDIPNGFSYLSNNKLYYSCSERYKLLKGWWGEASCVEGKWKTQECVASTDCGPVPDIPHLIVSSERTRFSNRDTFPIQCEAGHQNLNPDLQELTCIRGKWNSKGVEFKEICTPVAKKCRPPPKVKNAVVMAPFEMEYSSKTTLTYKCRDHFIMEGDGTIQCNNGTWEQKDISCKAVRQPQ